MKLMQYYYIKKGTPFFKSLFEDKEKLIEIIEKLKSYKSQETRKSSWDDQNLIGFFGIIKIILEKDPSLVQVALDHGIFNELMENCLFRYGV